MDADAEVGKTRGGALGAALLSPIRDRLREALLRRVQLVRLGFRVGRAPLVALLLQGTDTFHGQSKILTVISQTRN